MSSWKVSINWTIAGSLMCLCGGVGKNAMLMKLTDWNIFTWTLKKSRKFISCQLKHGICHDYLLSNKLSAFFSFSCENIS